MDSKEAPKSRPLLSYGFGHTAETFGLATGGDEQYRRENYSACSRYYAEHLPEINLPSGRS
jgi:hypothetical protein